jgi:hypothetical protein
MYISIDHCTIELLHKKTLSAASEGDNHQILAPIALPQE